MEPPEADIKTTDSKKWTILKVSVFAVLICEVSAWTYHPGDANMAWKAARKWCQDNYTDMVFIRNKNESKYLNETLPGSRPYYWIGIKKMANDTWIWVQTQEPVPEDLQTWATGEPSNSIREVCVEMYIKRPEDSGKWNNDRCDKEKRPLCYKDSCSNLTCGHHGECIEIIGNYNCDCWPGFHGKHCEHAISCMDLQKPASGNMNCSDVYGIFQFKSVCSFSCDKGFRLHGSKSSECQSTSEWSSPIPTCLAMPCMDLQMPANGNINCTNEYGKFQYKSFCNFSCDEGYEVHGRKAVLCQHTGEWSEPTPTCFAVSCVDLKILANGKIICTDEYGKSQYKSFCNFSCDEGYELNGTKSVFCQHTGKWSEPTPICLAWNVSTGKQKQITIVGSVLGTVGLSVLGTSVYILSYLRKKKAENAPIMKTKKDPSNTFENPAFEDKEIDALDL